MNTDGAMADVPIRRPSKNRAPSRKDVPTSNEGSLRFHDNLDDSPISPRLLRRDTSREARSLFADSGIGNLLVFVPLAILAGLCHIPPVLVFWLNFVAIIPLTSIVMIAVLKLSSDLGHVSGGILRAALGNTAEMVVWRCYNIPFPRYLLILV